MTANMDAENVILLTVDALRADHLSCYGYERPTSPTLDELATENIRFTSAWSTSSHTREAIPAILTGQYPVNAVGESYHRTAPTVAKTLRENGVSTGAFHSNPFVSRAYGFDDGFDEFDDDLHLGNHRIVALAQRVMDKLRNRHYARASTINERSLSWLDSLDDEPFFLWNHYMDVHGPYEPPEKYQQRFHDKVVSSRTAQKLYKRAIRSPDSISSDERKTLLNLYDAEIRYFDDRLEEFLNELRKRELVEGSLLIITSDHGDAFGEHGYYEHPRYLHDELTSVPLILAQESLSSRTVSSPVSTIDIAPTLLDAKNIRSDGLPGHTIYETLEESSKSRVVIASARDEDSPERRRFLLRTDQWTYAAEYDTADEKIIAEGQSPASVSQLSNEDEHLSNASEWRREGRQRLRHYLESGRAGNSQVESQDEEASAEVQNRLAALGYQE